MKIQQILQKYLTDWKNISQIDFCLLDSDNHITGATNASTFWKIPEAVSFAEFPRSDAAALPDFLQMFVGSLWNSAWIAVSGMDSLPTGYWS